MYSKFFGNKCIKFIWKTLVSSFCWLAVTLQLEKIKQWNGFYWFCSSVSIFDCIIWTRMQIFINTKHIHTDFCIIWYIWLIYEPFSLLHILSTQCLRRCHSTTMPQRMPQNHNASEDATQPQCLRGCHSTTMPQRTLLNHNASEDATWPHCLRGCHLTTMPQRILLDPNASEDAAQPQCLRGCHLTIMPQRILLDPNASEDATQPQCLRWCPLTTMPQRMLLNTNASKDATQPQCLRGCRSSTMCIHLGCTWRKLFKIYIVKQVLVPVYKREDTL